MEEENKSHDCTDERTNTESDQHTQSFDNEQEPDQYHYKEEEPEQDKEHDKNQNQEKINSPRVVWNEEHEILMRERMVDAKYYSALHGSSAKYFSKLNRYLSLPNKLLPGTVSFIQFSLTQNSTDITWSLYTCGFLSLLAMIIQVTVDFFNYQALITRHQRVEMMFDNMKMDIESELSFPPAKRVNVRTFFKKIQQVWKIAKQNAPEIPEFVSNKFSVEKSKEETEKEEKLQQQQQTSITNKPVPKEKLSDPFKISLFQQPPQSQPNQRKFSVTPTVSNNQKQLNKQQHDVQVHVDKEDDDDMTSIQDEYMKQMKAKIEHSRKEREQYQLSRFASL